MSAKDNPIEIVRFLEKHWYEKSGLVAALIFTTIVEGTLLSKGGASGKETFLVFVVSWIAIVTAWWFTALRIPKTPKDMVGFLVSIECPDDKESEKLREDFVVPLRQLIKSGKVGGDFHFIQLPQHQARKIKEHDDAKALAAKTGAHFIFYGRVRLREIEGKEHHIIDLEGAVSHKPIPIAVSEILAREFSELLPRKVRMPTDNDYLTLEFTSEWAEKVAKYIIGIAASCSGDFDYAETLFLDVQKRLDGKHKGFPIYAKLEERIPIRLSELNEVRAKGALLKWNESCDDADIDELGSYLEKIDESRRNEPIVLTLSAIHAFLKNRDIKAAKAFLRKLKKELGGVFNYDMAFLCGYERDLAGAIRHYRKAIGYDVEPDIITQVEDFICLFLEQEPDKYQLFHCLGFFYWKVKGDLILAETAFNNFLNTGDKNEFIKERELAAKWLEEIKQAQNEE